MYLYHLTLEILPMYGWRSTKFEVLLPPDLLMLFLFCFCFLFWTPPSSALWSLMDIFNCKLWETCCYFSFRIFGMKWTKVLSALRLKRCQIWLCSRVRPQNSRFPKIPSCSCDDMTRSFHLRLTEMKSRRRSAPLLLNHTSCFCSTVFRYRMQKEIRTRWITDGESQTVNHRQCIQWEDQEVQPKEIQKNKKNCCKLTSSAHRFWRAGNCFQSELKSWTQDFSDSLLTDLVNWTHSRSGSEEVFWKLVQRVTSLTLCKRC